MIFSFISIRSFLKKSSASQKIYNAVNITVPRKKCSAGRQSTFPLYRDLLGAKHIKFIGLIAAPEGIKALHEAHPDVDIYLGAQDDHLNENGYIVPGLGDAGDRIYGTK